MAKQYETHNLSISGRILQITDDNFKQTPMIISKLMDPFVVYYDGHNHKAYPLDIFNHYCLIYDVITNDESDTADSYYDVSVYVAPQTLLSCVLQHRLSLSTKHDNGLILLEHDGEIIHPIQQITDARGDKHWEVKILTLRNALSLYPDILFYHNDNTNMPPSIVFKLDDTDKLKYHAMTLVYLIIYVSCRTRNDKYTILIGHDANKHKATGYNLTTSGMLEYLTQYEDKIRERNGDIIPMRYGFAAKYFDTAKVIKL